MKSRKFEELNNDEWRETNHDSIRYQRFTYFIEISKRSFLCSYSHNLGRSHDEFLLLAGDHIWIFFTHDFKNTVQKFIVGVISVRATPSNAFILDYGKERKII